MLNEVFRMEKLVAFYERIFYFLLINLLFLLFNLPMLLFFLFVGMNKVIAYLPLFLTCMIPFFPALSAVYYAMLKVVKGTEVSPIKDFWKGYRSDWLQKLRLSCLHLLTVFILVSNIQFFSKSIVVLPLVIFFCVLLLGAFLIIPNLYLLASRYQMGNFALLKAALILTVTRPIYTLGSAVAFLIILLLLELAAGITVLFVASVYGFLVVFMSRQLLDSLEQKQEPAIQE